MPNPAFRKRIEEIKGMETFPLPKGAAMALIRLTQREGTSLAVMAHALKADPALSVRVIRVANGVSGTEQGPLVSLRDAVNVLGVPAVRSLAMGFSLLEHHRSGACSSFDYPRFWSHALARAAALQLLAGLRAGCPPADAFSVGLIARIGELVLATVFSQPYGDLLQQWRAGQVLAQREQEAFGASSGALTASLMLDYNLPDECVAAVEVFDLPAAASRQDGDDAILRQLLVLADYIGAVCVAAPTEWRGLMPKLFQLGAKLSLKAEALTALCNRTAHEWREWGGMLELETGPMPHFEEAVALPPDVPEASRTTEPPRVSKAAGPPKVTEPPGAPKPVELPRTAKPPRPPEPEVRAAATSGDAAGPMSILLVGDEARLRNPLREVLAAAGYRVAEAPNGRQGLTMAIELQPPIMLLDLLSTEIDGIELTRTLRQFKAGRSIYILILSDRDDDEKLIAAFAAGADGFLTLPLQPRILTARLQAGRRAANLREELGQEQEKIRRISAELAVSNQQLQEVGMTDLLTGCRNRRYAMERMQQEWAMAVRSERPLACMVIDVDHLKQLNDTHGHDAGDTALKLVVSAFREETRAQDVLARSGGDEFLVICPDTTLEAALACAGRMRAAVEALPVVGGARTVHGSVSIGVAVRDATTPDADALIRLADQSAYLAKRHRNAVATVQSSATLSQRTA
ncbi:MAG: diguanylate cyclase [Betaproteobacteria bacterium]|nr:diguanylate cyclase [Betaproteobacteria bacterium]